MLQTATNSLLTGIDSDTNDIKTAVQIIDDAIHAEDSAHSSGHKGIPSLFLRQDSHSDLAADGDYMIPTIDANGDIRIHDAVSNAILDSILDKLAPVKTSSKVIDNVTIGDGGHHTSSSIDIRTVKHIGFGGADTGSSGTVEIQASETTNGFFFVVSTGVFQSGVLEISPLQNTAYKFLKVKINNTGGSSSDYSVVIFLSS